MSLPSLFRCLRLITSFVSDAEDDAMVHGCWNFTTFLVSPIVCSSLLFLNYFNVNDDELYRMK
jgi:hypothetical protein